MSEMYCCFKPVRLARSPWVRRARSRARLRFRPNIADVRLDKLTSKLGTKSRGGLPPGCSADKVVVTRSVPSRGFNSVNAVLNKQNAKGSSRDSVQLTAHSRALGRC